MKRISLALLVLLVAVISPAQQQDPHAGQPATCDTHTCSCNHATDCPMPGVEPTPEDEHCLVYCRHDACSCQESHCAT